MNIILTLVVIIFICMIIGKRNEFQRLRRKIKQSISEISIYQENRAASLNDALSIAKTSYSHEVEGIERLTAKDQLEQLRYLGEKYPGLNSTGQYAQVIQQAFALQREITATRTIVNQNVDEYNDAITAFPAMILAALLGYKKEKFIDEENESENRKLSKTTVDFDKY